MGCPLPVVTTACAGQVECKRLVNTDAIEWSVAMQMGGQVHAITHIAPFNGEARNNCPYFSPRQHKKIDRKASFDGIPRKILKLLIEQFDRGNRLANSPLSTQTSSDKNGWKTKPCPQVYPLNKPVSDVGHAEPASGSQSTMASLYTSAPHTP